MPSDAGLEYPEDVTVPDEIITDPDLPQTPLLDPTQLDVGVLTTPQSARSKESFSVLARIPLDIQEFRERVFTLDEPVSFDRQTWDRYWPFIDNVWCLHNRMEADMGLNRGVPEKFWGGCRLQRKWDHHVSNPAPKGLRNRARRPTGTCVAKFKLTINPDGTRLLERSTKDGHTHDLDHIDSIKRNSGVRSLVLDPFFNSWEPATIMAYLRDEEHWLHGRDMLTEAGGKYLERREIMNVFSLHLRKLYPGLDVGAIRKEQDKYKAMKTCNYKGCNRSFADGKALAAHRRTEHPAREPKKRDTSNASYTCPSRGCHRRKKSKSYSSQSALRKHQIKMQHWGVGSLHGEHGPVDCEEVSEGATLLPSQTADGDVPSVGIDDMHEIAHPTVDDMHIDQSGQPQLSVPQRPLPNPDHTLLPLIAQGVSQLHEQQAREAEEAQKSQQVAQAQQAQDMMPIDPAMEAAIVPHEKSGERDTAVAELPAQQSAPLTAEQRQAALDRYNQLQLEMQEIQTKLWASS